MPLNFQQVVDRIRRIGSEARARQEDLKQRREKAVSLLEDWADKGAELRAKVERARQADPALRCALPLDERLDTSAPEPEASASVTLIAADGSQITPDRHAAVLYGLINVGAIAFRGGADEAPWIFTDSNLFYDDEVTDWTDGLVALKRDLAEREKLLELSQQYPLPLVTLTDGPLQLWEARESNEVQDFKESLGEYLKVLEKLHRYGATTAGYVDKPSSNLLVRLLEIALAPGNELKDIHAFHPLPGVTDLWLVGRFLAPGARSAVFALQARSKAVYAGPLALHFFYLNVGGENHPSIVRVEIPQWVAGEAAKLDQLHACLLQQCRVMGARPYPYILHRAHEVAVVKLEEKQQVGQMLAQELLRAGGEIGEESAKSVTHNLPGRRSRK